MSTHVKSMNEDLRADDTPIDFSSVEKIVLKPNFPRPRRHESPDKHEFWKSQPVPRYAEAAAATNAGFLTETLDGVRTSPLDLPPGLQWTYLDFSRCAGEISPDLTEVCKFLAREYTNDDESPFQFNYSAEFLEWALCPPVYSPSLHIGIRYVRSDTHHSATDHSATDHSATHHSCCSDDSHDIANNELVGFISGTPCNIRVYGTSKRMVEINFLCIHKHFRSVSPNSDKIAPILIEEVARRVRFLGIWQAVYTSIMPLPHSLATVTYHHRALNFRKLVDTGFSTARAGLSMAAQESLYKLPEPAELLKTFDKLYEKTVQKGKSLQKTTQKGKSAQQSVQKSAQKSVRHITELRELIPRDISGVCRLVNKFLSAYHLAQEYSEAEFAHVFLPRKNIVSSYVLICNGVITSFISYYGIDHKVVSSHDNLREAYAFHIIPGIYPLSNIMNLTLSLAAKEGFDVFNCLDIMENSQVFNGLKFSQGTGKMKYYLYNWNCEPTQPGGIGVVLK